MRNHGFIVAVDSRPDPVADIVAIAAITAVDAFAIAIAAIVEPIDFKSIDFKPVDEIDPGRIGGEVLEA